MDEAMAHLLVGDTLMLDGDLPEAGRAYLRAVLLLNEHGDERVVEAYLRLETVSTGRGRPGVGRRYLERALTVVPLHPVALRRLIRWYAERELWDDVLPLEESLLEALVDDAEALQIELLRAGDRWWRRAGDIDMAWRRYDEAAERFPDSARVRVRRRALASTLAPPSSGAPPSSVAPPESLAPPVSGFPGDSLAPPAKESRDRLRLVPSARASSPGRG